MKALLNNTWRIREQHLFRCVRVSEECYRSVFTSVSCLLNLKYTT